MASHPAGSKPSTAAAPLLCAETHKKNDRFSRLQIAHPKQNRIPTHTPSRVTDEQTEQTEGAAREDCVCERERRWCCHYAFPFIGGLLIWLMGLAAVATVRGDHIHTCNGGSMKKKRRVDEGWGDMQVWLLLSVDLYDEKDLNVRTWKRRRIKRRTLAVTACKDGGLAKLAVDKKKREWELSVATWNH